MSSIQIHEVLPPNTIRGISNQIKLRDLTFTIKNNTIEILERINPIANIHIIIPSDMVKNFTIQFIYD